MKIKFQNKIYIKYKNLNRAIFTKNELIGGLMV